MSVAMVLVSPPSFHACAPLAVPVTLHFSPDYHRSLIAFYVLLQALPIKPHVFVHNVILAFDE